MVEARNNDNSDSDKVSPEVRVRVFGRTDVGMVREHNEDNFLIADLTRKNRSILPEVQEHVIGEFGSVFAVCDGMGGAAAGEVASKIGVDTIYEVLQADTPPADEAEFASRLNAAICTAGKKIFAESKANSSRRGMGTTATVAVLMNQRILYGQVGDSRAHIIRKGQLVQTTKDQSLVQQLIDANQLTVEEAKNFDRSNIILQALGTSEDVHVDITSTVLCKGDILVICSDGLSGLVEPEDIRDVVLAINDPIEACQKLTQMACDNGGDDNVTVIVAHFDGEGLKAPTAQDVVAYEKFILPGADDDDSITLPRGMPAVPGSAARAEQDARLAKQKSSGKMPFFILLTALVLIGLVVGFSMTGNSDKTPDSASPPSFNASTAGNSADVAANSKSGNHGDSTSETNVDTSNGQTGDGLADETLIADSAGSDAAGGADSADTDLPTSTTSLDGDSALDGDATPAVGTHVDSESSQNSGSLAVDSASTVQGPSKKVEKAGQWARTKTERKRRSAAADTDVDSVSDTSAVESVSSEGPAAAGTSGRAPSQTDTVPVVDENPY